MKITYKEDWYFKFFYYSCEGCDCYDCCCICFFKCFILVVTFKCFGWSLIGEGVREFFSILT